MGNLPLIKGDLVVGQKLNLTKASTSGTLSKLMIGLGWDENSAKIGNHDFDADVSILLKESIDPNEVCKAKNLIFFNQLVSEDGEQRKKPDGSYEVVRPGYVTHNGDNRTGAGDGDDETIDIDLTRVPSNIVMMVVAVTIYDFAARKQNFGMLNNAFIRVVNAETGEQLGKLELDFEASNETGIIFGVILRRDSDWFFMTPPQLESFPNGINGFVSKFNIQ